MENPIIVPFDLNTARKIKSGEIEGSVLIGNIKIEFVYESKDCADRYNLLFVKKDESGISAIYADTEGRTFFNNVLELEVEAGAYFKKGDVLISTLGNPFIYKGFIAGGCFKNILSGERVKDIDIFFESESDFQEAIDSFNDEKHQKEGWKFKYRNEKVCAFQKEGEKVWVEFIESEFGKPEEILRSFDFTVAKMAYYKEPKYEEKEDDYFPFSSTDVVGYEYKLLYHEKFFEHLHMKRLVIDENIPFPVSTWERSYRYKGYGYNMCRETKKKLLQAIKGVNVEEEDVSLYTTGGWD